MQQEMEFATRKELIEDIRNSKEQEGMVLTIKTSKEKWVVLKCDQGGEYVNMLNLTDETRQSKKVLQVSTFKYLIHCNQCMSAENPG